MQGQSAESPGRPEHSKQPEHFGRAEQVGDTEQVGRAEPFQRTGPWQRVEPFQRGTVSFVRRDDRLRPRLQRTWDAHHEEWVLDVPRVQATMSVAPGYLLDPVRDFGRVAPLVVEIGSGTGDAVVHAAAARPGTNFLAVEVYRPGLASTVAKIVRHDLTNVRLVQADAVQVLKNMLGQGSVSEIWVFFADPWHKSRHHKRRLVNSGFADLAASRLAMGGPLRLATDWADYAIQQRDVLAACDSLINPWRGPTLSHPGGGTIPAGPVGSENGFAPRFQGRVMTRFEQKALASGRTIYDLELRRVGAAEAGPCSR
ncbi:MAG TPA: tRNA (guanosine(46)-N7)-methyltransferase TrmB [Dermatophilaceae bacterium]